MPKTLPKTHHGSPTRATIIIDLTDTGYVYLDDPYAAVKPLVAEVCKRLAPLGVHPQDIVVEFAS